MTLLEWRRGKVYIYTCCSYYMFLTAKTFSCVWAMKWVWMLIVHGFCLFRHSSWALNPYVGYSAFQEQKCHGPVVMPFRVNSCKSNCLIFFFSPDLQRDDTLGMCHFLGYISFLNQQWIFLLNHGHKRNKQKYWKKQGLLTYTCF